MDVKRTVRRTTHRQCSYANINIIISEAPPTGFTKELEELY